MGMYVKLCKSLMANLRHAFEEHGKKTLTLGVEMPWTGWYRQSEGNLSRFDRQK